MKIIRMLKKARKLIKEAKTKEKQEFQYKGKLIITLLELNQIFEYEQQDGTPIDEKYLVEQADTKEIEETIEQSLDQLEKMI